MCGMETRIQRVEGQVDGGEAKYRPEFFEM